MILALQSRLFNLFLSDNYNSVIRPPSSANKFCATAAKDPQKYKYLISLTISARRILNLSSPPAHTLPCASKFSFLHYKLHSQDAVLAH